MTIDALIGFRGARFAALLLSLFATCVAFPARGQSSPDGLWQVEHNAQFPPRYSPPSALNALRLDAGRLGARIETVPRETFGPIPRAVLLSLPLPDGSFATVAMAETQMMEPALAAQFPQIRTYIFDSQGGVTGQMALGPRGVFVTAQTPAGLVRVEPVETSAGRIYVSYFDRHRTDGADVIEHDPHMPEGDTPSVPAVTGAVAVALAQAGFAPVPQIAAGNQLRIYRLAASTTGEFYQGRDTGNGLLDVLFSLIIDLIGANAVFEPEVSVRLILSLASLDVIYDDPDTDPFQQDDDPNTDDGDPDTSGDVEGEACDLREANRANMQAVLNDADYDLGFLFAARSGNGANGCAWYVVCLTTDNTLHKARGAGKMGNNGANSASGLLAHEVGHMLGARHTFSGKDGACTKNEFLAGDSESGYEPGSGTTRMSYRGNCDSDDVDTTGPGAVPAGSYFHSRSFDEIVDNVLNGDGATCGTLVATANQPPAVNAGPDYTVPRQTPFTLSGTAFDAEPLIFNWEQYDRALVQRPIDTDPGDGPIIRSVPPGTDSARTVPNLQDLLDNVQRKGEILPQVDRDLNFRLIARDNLMGGGGVAYDAMVVHVQGAPFFITSPNSGIFQADCPVPLTWEVGGGAVAPQVAVLFSSDGGQNFNQTLAAAVPNNGEYAMTMPCTLGASGRLKLQSVGNIFFDVNDQNLTLYNNPPTVNVATAGGAVDGACQFTVEFSASATDACGLNAADVSVELIKAANNFTLGTPTINTVQVSPTEVGVSGSVLVSDLLNSPAQLTVSVTAADGCGAQTNDTAEAVIVDNTPPQISVSLQPNSLWPPNHKMIPIQASVITSDNCPGVSYTLTSVTSNEPDDNGGDGNTSPDIQDTALGTPDLNFSLRSERAGGGTGRVYTVTYTAEDGSENEAADAAEVTVPKSP